MTGTAHEHHQMQPTTEACGKVESEQSTLTAVEKRKVQLQEKYLEVYQSVSQLMQDELRDFYNAELKAEVWKNADEIRKEIREQLAQELAPQVKQELVKKYREEIHSNLPKLYQEEIEEYKISVTAHIKEDYLPLLKAEIREQYEAVFMHKLRDRLEEQYTQTMPQDDFVLDVANSSFRPNILHSLKICPSNDSHCRNPPSLEHTRFLAGQLRHMASYSIPKSI